MFPEEELESRKRQVDMGTELGGKNQEIEQWINGTETDENVDRMQQEMEQDIAEVRWVTINGDGTDGLSAEVDTLIITKILEIVRHGKRLT